MPIAKKGQDQVPFLHVLLVSVQAGWCGPPTSCTSWHQPYKLGWPGKEGIRVLGVSQDLVNHLSRMSGTNRDLHPWLRFYLFVWYSSPRPNSQVAPKHLAFLTFVSLNSNADDHVFVMRAIYIYVSWQFKTLFQQSLLRLFCFFQLLKLGCLIFSSDYLNGLTLHSLSPLYEKKKHSMYDFMWPFTGSATNKARYLWETDFGGYHNFCEW